MLLDYLDFKYDAKARRFRMMAYSVSTTTPEELFAEKIKPLVQGLAGIRREREIACEICATDAISVIRWRLGLFGCDSN